MLGILLAIAPAKSSATDPVAAPPYDPAEVVHAFSQDSYIFPNALGDVAASVTTDNTAYHAIYWSGGAQLSADLLHQQTIGYNEFVSGVNDQGDVLVRVANFNAPAVQWLLWRTGRGNTGQTVVQPPIPAATTGYVYMNQQGDLSWQAWLSTAWHTYLWHPGDALATEVPNAGGQPTSWWLIRNRTDPQDPSTVSLVLYNQAGTSYLWNSAQGAQPLTGFPAGASSIVPQFCDATGNIAGVLNLGGQSSLLWFYRQSSGTTFVSSQVCNSGNFSFNNSGQALGHRLSDGAPCVWTLTEDGSGSLGETVHALPLLQTSQGFWSGSPGQLNDSGVVIGVGPGAFDRQVPMLWKPDATGNYGPPFKLQDCLPAHTRWGLSAVYDIDNLGHILGIGLHGGGYALWQLQPLQDTDGNGLPDAWQLAYFSQLGNLPNDDPDHDGLTNIGEYHAGTDPTNPDTDGDLIPDGWEDLHGYNPLLAADAAYQLKHTGLTTLQEYQHGVDPSPRYTLVGLPKSVLQFGYGMPLPTLNAQLQIGINTPITDDDGEVIGSQAFRLRLSGTSFLQDQIHSWNSDQTGSEDNHAWIFNLNSQGKAVGYAMDSSYGYYPYLWSDHQTATGGKLKLITQGGGYAYSVSDGADGTEKVVGMRPVSQHAAPFFWAANGGTPTLIDITPSGYPGGFRSLSTVGINPTGTLVFGSFQDTAYHMHGFLWDPTQTPPDGFSFPPRPDGADYAFIGGNSQGDLLGVRYGSQYLTWDDLPFFWKAGLTAAPVTLPTLGGVSATARAMNNSGLVVGLGMASSGAYHGFLWDPSAGPAGQMVDLNALIDNPSNLWEITDAAAINDHGDIVAEVVFYGTSSTDPNIVPVACPRFLIHLL
ncbi:MAG: hypothetical protein ABJF10_29180 [Chthoniobacter sp.]|uniref:hypothetical protein n=1 Tax=Chthoniobacter sp. TaxID=2510640 RepID=UPI0032A30207